MKTAGIAVVPWMVATAWGAGAEEIRPLFAKYCNGCHTGEKAAAGLDLATLPDPLAAPHLRRSWLRVHERVKAREMPPTGAQPSEEEREWIVRAVDRALAEAAARQKPNPGHVVIPRLNRIEYNDTIRDLTGLDMRPADAFPEDTFGESGFNNDRSALFIPPILVEKYLSAAQTVVDEMIEQRANLPVLMRKLEVERDMLNTETQTATKAYGYDIQAPQNTIYQYIGFPKFGRYTFRIRAWGQAKVPGALPGVALRVAGEMKAQFPVEATKDAPGLYVATVNAPRGTHRVSLHFYQAILEDPKRKAERPALGQLILSLDSLEIEQAREDRPRPEIFVSPRAGLSEPEAAKRTLQRFAERAWRRPVTAEETAYLTSLYRRGADRGDTWEQSVALGLKAILVSPNFLFRPEAQAKPKSSAALNDFELASRMSYFLWLSMPDEELSALARRGKLRDSKVRAAQLKRMLADPKAEAFATAFFSQWLGYRELGKSALPDRATFPSFTDAMRESALAEAGAFFSDLVRRDESLLRAIDADYSFLNEDLARLYAVEGVKGPELRRVAFSDPRRGGVTGMAAVLATTSTPVRTSPVLRGKWVAMTLLGEEIPPPPVAADLPEVTPATKSMTLRQRLELHRNAPQCMGCHNRMDPLGFGLENFDAVGRWRDKDNGQPVDSVGKLANGREFSGPVELKRILLERKEEFARNVSRQMLKFALGRELRYYDERTVNEASRRFISGGYRPSKLVEAIVESLPFRQQSAGDGETN